MTGCIFDRGKIQPDIHVIRLGLCRGFSHGVCFEADWVYDQSDTGTVTTCHIHFNLLNGLIAACSIHHGAAGISEDGWGYQ